MLRILISIFASILAKIIIVLICNFIIILIGISQKRWHVQLSGTISRPAFHSAEFRLGSLGFWLVIGSAFFFVNTTKILLKMFIAHISYNLYCSWLGFERSPILTWAWSASFVIDLPFLCGHYHLRNTINSTIFRIARLII